MRVTSSTEDETPLKKSETTLLGNITLCDKILLGTAVATLIGICSIPNAITKQEGFPFE